MTNQPVALITGSGRKRVGWHVAQSLADRGYALAVHYHRSAADAEQTVADFAARGVTAMKVQADLADEAAVQAMVDSVLERFQRIDVLVNSAAIWERKPLEQVTAADLRVHFEVNALGTFLCAQRAGLAMVRQDQGGSIINLGDWAIERPYLDFAAYFPSKGAVVALTRSLAVELGHRNPRVRVNCILPGPVMLPDDFDADERQRVINATLVKREGTPQHVARAAVHLIENDFITGVCLPVDGGRTIFSPDSVR
jgi:pteridine reductase